MRIKVKNEWSREFDWQKYFGKNGSGLGWETQININKTDLIPPSTAPSTPAGPFEASNPNHEPPTTITNHMIMDQL